MGGEELEAMRRRDDVQDEDTRPWAPPRVGVLVERRDAWEIVVHGARGGMLAGVALGLTEIVASTLLRNEPGFPFRFAVAIAVGPEALAPTFPLAASVVLGLVIHFSLSVVFGVAFLAGLALAFQLSARWWLMVLYGVVFAGVVWEVCFLAIVPLVAPALAGQLDLTTQLWNGLASYCLVYGPVLAFYVVRARPGVVDRWWRVDGEEAG